MRVRAILLAAALVLAPLAARAADLVVWWEEGYQPDEVRAVRELGVAFEKKTGKQVELAFHSLEDLPARTLAAVEAGRPPDFVFGQRTGEYYDRWAYEGRLVDLADTLGTLAAEFDRDLLDSATLLDGATGKRALYALPMTNATNHVHVWKSLLERAGFTLADIPRDWEAFWSFWCDRVQPAFRQVTGRDDVYGVALAMSQASDTDDQFWQFVHAYEADYVTRDGRLVIDEPLIRNKLAKVLDSYTAVYRKGCTPPEAIGWDSSGNNKAFLAQTVVMTVNATLSIPGALRATRPEDYYKNMVTIGWPSDASGRPLVIYTPFNTAVVFRDGGHTAAAKEFVRFLVGEGWLAHWLDFAGDRFLPSMPALLNSPFWLDPGDPHRMPSAIQFLTQPHDYDYGAASGLWRHARVYQENIWPKAIQRIVVDGLSPEQAADEAIARIKHLLSE